MTRRLCVAHIFCSHDHENNSNDIGRIIHTLDHQYCVGGRADLSTLWFCPMKIEKEIVINPQLLVKCETSDAKVPKADSALSAQLLATSKPRWRRALHLAAGGTSSTCHEPLRRKRRNSQSSPSSPASTRTTATGTATGTPGATTEFQ